MVNGQVDGTMNFLLVQLFIGVEKEELQGFMGLPDSFTDMTCPLLKLLATFNTTGGALPRRTQALVGQAGAGENNQGKQDRDTRIADTQAVEILFWWLAGHLSQVRLVFQLYQYIHFGTEPG